ncbi:hypothetical protein GGI05_006912 [Coemansia sp. RSA 2603]|nr:hypothetical protein GGI05_006912 [Coemansia sp. RSA 2603]
MSVKEAAGPAVAPQVTLSTVSEETESMDDAADATQQSSVGCRLVGEHGIVDLDGEQVELGPIKIECLASLVNVICPPWLDESQCARVGTVPATKIFEPIKGSLSREGSLLSFTNI